MTSTCELEKRAGCSLFMCVYVDDLLRKRKERKNSLFFNETRERERESKKNERTKRRLIMCLQSKFDQERVERFLSFKS